jgi:rhamnosyltransferase
MGWFNDARRDLGFCRRARRLREWPRALRIRWEQRLARRAGFKAGWAMHREHLQAEF